MLTCTTIAQLTYQYLVTYSSLAKGVKQGRGFISKKINILSPLFWRHVQAYASQLLLGFLSHTYP